MIFFYSFLIFLFGVILGSFANVCIYRLPRDKQIISGRSYCPRCKKKIKWYDNLPLISYIFLNAKCRNCDKSISVRYLIVELITGISFLLIFLSFKNLYTIIFLSRSNEPVSIDKLQEKVWSYQSNIETHTVETHIYRLRKKILNSFKDNEFIISKKNGYQIK